MGKKLSELEKKKIFEMMNPISKILNLDIDIVDKTGVRVLGTGIYRKREGKQTNEIVYQKAIKKNRVLVIENPRENGECIECILGFKCLQKLMIISPISYENRTWGTISFVTFNDSLKDKIIEKIEDYTKYLENLVLLLVKEYFTESNLEIYREFFLNNDENIIILDGENNIIDFNKGSELFFPENEKLIGKKFYMKHLNNKNYEINLLGMKKEVVIEIEEKKKNLRILYIKKIFEMKNIMMDDGILLGKSQAMKELKEKMLRLLNLNLPILIKGGIGTKKEMFAKWLHKNSERKNNRFISVNCLDEKYMKLGDEKYYIELIQNELDLAIGGTIFFDEIESMQLFLQERLLMFLNSKKIDKTTKNNVRVIVGTKKNMLELVEKNEFLEDLYYKLNLHILDIPDLKHRKDDILEILDYLLTKYSKEMGKTIKKIEKESKMILLNYEWKGNWKEIDGAIKYIVDLVEEDGVIKSSYIPEKIRRTYNYEDFKNRKIRKLEDLEREEIVAGLIQYGVTSESKKQISNKLGIGIATLYRKIENYQIDKKEIEKFLNPYKKKSLNKK